jgi:hypothetical protein
MPISEREGGREGGRVQAFLSSIYVKTCSAVGLLPIHLKWLRVDGFKVFESNSDVKSTNKITSKLHIISKL